MLILGEQSRACKELSQDARAIAGRQAVLYHGTRHPRSVLRMNTLFYSHQGSAQVSFTRSPEVAAYWALLERDNDEGKGAILVFNGSKLVGSKKTTSPEKQRRNRSFQKRLALRSEGIEPELAFEMVKGRRQTLDDLEPILNVGLSNFAMKLKT
jgi:hypothetical protein